MNYSCGTCILVIGLPGAGKSTFANLLSVIDANFIRIGTDDIRKSLRLSMSDPASISTVYELAVAHARNVLTMGKTPVLDATFYRRSWRLLVTTNLATEIACFVLVRIATDFNLCMNRVNRRQLSGADPYDGVTSNYILKMVDHEFEEVSDNEKSKYCALVKVRSLESRFKIDEVVGKLPQHISMVFHSASLYRLDQSLNYLKTEEKHA